MPDDTTAALQALIQQVSALTETVQSQAKRLDDLHAFNGRILDEKKDADRAKDSALSKLERTLAQLNDQQRDRALENANLARDANGNILLNSGAPSGHTISRADARDPVKYRAAKEAAAKAGEPLRISDGISADPTRRNTLSLPEIAKTKTISLTDDHYKVQYHRADHAAGNGFVHRRLEAERAGFKVVTWRTPEDLPEHMQAKLHLMEKAHDAQADS